jgi:hypothetical protein
MRADRKAAAKGVNQIDRFTIQHAIALEDRKVVMTFNRPIPNIWATPAEAIEMAKHLLMGAQQMEPTTVNGFDWPGKQAVTEVIGTSVRPS